MIKLIKIQEAIVVEGKYDKIKLSSIFDTIIVPTNGFAIFKDDKKLNLIRKLAKVCGIVILTDSDAAGFVIRNYISGCVPKDSVKHAYIPQISGKEKRKDTYSKEGFLGVEGITDEIIKQAVLKAQSVDIAPESKSKCTWTVTNADFFEAGLYGRVNSKEKRDRLIKKLGLPSYLSTNALREILPYYMMQEEFRNYLSADGVDS